MWTELDMSPRAIAALAGWKITTVIKMLETYGHGEWARLRRWMPSLLGQAATSAICGLSGMRS